MTPGTVVTFYSYKGGVGRTFVLVNVGVLLARWGWRVLLVDLDLEAPGLDRYLRNVLPSDRAEGFVELVASVRDGAPRDWRRLVQRADLGFAGTVDVLRAGLEDEGYLGRLKSLDWPGLYAAHDLGRTLDRWRDEWAQTYDLVLLDARTGWADLQGITTAQLPDILVALFTGNDQSFEGAMRVARRARTQRDALPTRPGPLPVVPVVTRFDPAAGAPAHEWDRRLAHRLPEFLDWVDADLPPAALLPSLRVGYHAAFAFGEGLPALSGDPLDRTSFVGEIAPLAALLARGLDGADAAVADRVGLLAGAQKHADAQPVALTRVLVMGTPDRAADTDALVEALHAAGVDVLLEPTPGGAGAAALWADVPGAHVVLVVGVEVPRAWRVELAGMRALAAEEGERRLIAVVTAPNAAGMNSFQALVGPLSPPSVLAALGLGDPVSPPVEPVAAWLAYVRERHSRLVPFFPGAADKVLTEVFVELEVEWEADALPCGKHGDAHLHHPGAPLTLRRLAAIAPRAAILGDPGAGKTTLLRHLAATLAAEPGGPVPLYIPLARLGGAWQDPYLLAESDLRAASPGSPTGLAAALRGRDVWLLLDGVDEIDQRQMETVREAIDAFARAHPNVTILVTSRVVGRDVGGIPAGFRVAKVRGLDAERQRQLLQRLLGEERAEPVVAELERRPALAELARSPLMLTLLAVVAREAGATGTGLPSRPARLYGMAVDLLLRRGFAVEPAGVRDPELARRLLRRLSLQLQEEGGEAWTRSEVSDRLLAERDAEPDLRARVLETWRSHAHLLDDLGVNGGVLGPHDGPGAWRYLHRSLREYLAAEQLLAGGPERIEAFARDWTRAEAAKKEAERGRKPDAPPVVVADPARWGEVHALLCGLVPDPLPLLAQLRGVNPALARRSLTTVDAPAAAVIPFLFAEADWVEDDVLTLAERHREAVIAPLRQQVVPGASSRILGIVAYVLDRLGAFHPDAFFAACRPGVRPPQLDTVTIPAGTFWMGSPGEVGYGDEHPRHEVTLTRPFRLGRHPVTAGEWHVFAGGDRPRNVRLPAVGMTWYEAWLYARWVGGALPTEAEWEYACRAGTDTRWSFGDNEAALGEYAWFDRNAGHETHAVGQKKPNRWGLHDMHGNVWEWCQDYQTYGGAVTDPIAEPPPLGAPGVRAARGGAFWNDAVRCRSAYRSGWHPGYRLDYLGFRVRLPPP